MKLFVRCTTCGKRVWAWQSQISSTIYSQDFKTKTYKGNYHYNKRCYPEYDFIEFLKQDGNIEKKMTKEEIIDFIKKRGETIDP